MLACLKQISFTSNTKPNTFFIFENVYYKFGAQRWLLVVGVGLGVYKHVFGAWH